MLAGFKLFLFALNIVWVLPVQLLAVLFFRGAGVYYIPQIWHGVCCRIFGIQIEVLGKPRRDGQVIFMANHISYLDISVLGALLRGAFVAKQEVEGWALFGFLSKLQRTLFISRDRKAAKYVQAQLDARLHAGESLILFPEGTSTDGRDVRPFKSSLFSLVVGSDVPGLMVQPVTIQVVQADGQDVTRQSPQEILDIYAWHVDMDEDIDLGLHLSRFAARRGAKVRVTFHEPFDASLYSDRKVAAKKCYDAVRGGLL